MTAEQIVDALIHDLNGRSGFDLWALDKETFAELKSSWIKIVEKGMSRGHEPAADTRRKNQS